MSIVRSLFDHLHLGLIVFVVTFVSLELYHQPIQASSLPYTPLPPVVPTVDLAPDQKKIHPRLSGLDTWERPDGPWRVALQVGHLNTANAPDELRSIRNNTGTSYGTLTEVALNAQIAQHVRDILEAAGVRVEILPTTIPPNHWSDVFVSIHADGNASRSVRGFKTAPSWSDFTDKGHLLAHAISTAYAEATNLPLDHNITANMRGYYAFNWRRFNHSVHPLTVSAIVETGFLTNAQDRLFLTQNPELSAQGIADGILFFLRNDAARSML